MFLQDMVGFIAVTGVIWGLRAAISALANSLEPSAVAMLPMAGVALLTALFGALVCFKRLDRLRASLHAQSIVSSASIGPMASEQMTYFLSTVAAAHSPTETVLPGRMNFWSKDTVRRCMRFVTIILSVGLTCIIAFVVLFGNNFHTVNESLYRSGQLRSDDWTETYSAHPYRSVLNLRGEAKGRTWYTQETNFSAANGLAHYDFTMSSTIVPTDNQMEALVDLMRRAPKPLLIHCRSGADRSGLASALYLYAIEGVDPAEAMKQLSIWYGHFPWLTSRTGAMDEALARFVRTHSRGVDAGYAAAFASR